MFQIREHPAYPYLLRIVLAIITLVLIYQIFQIWQTTQFGSAGTVDLSGYWTAGQLLRQGQDPYDATQQFEIQIELGSDREEPNQIWNPPWLLVWIAPLLWLSFPAAVITWLVVNFALILGCGTAIWRFFASPGTRDKVGMAWITTIAFMPALFTLQMGQISTLVLIGVVGFLLCISRNRDYLAGFFLAFTSIKPHVVYLLWIAIIWWIWTEKRWKVLAGMASLILPTLLLLSLMWWDWIIDYFIYMANQGLPYLAPTLGGTLRLVFHSNSPILQYGPTLLVGLTFLGYLIWRQPHIRWKSAISPILLLSITTAAYGWSFDQIILLIPYMEIMVWLNENHTIRTSQKLAVVLYLLLTAAMMITLNLARANDVFFFWVPWVLAAMFLHVRLHPAVSINRPAPHRMDLNTVEQTSA